MQQLRLGTATRILETTETESEIDENWVGGFQIFMSVAGTADVNLQIKRPGTNTYINARYNGTDITLSAAGDVLDILLVEHFNYRLHTATAGAEVYASNH